ncbi:MAG: DUF3574 domain-containing protein [Dehalococcoidia bacterium]|nr:DUF3574 domain-containing protein [Dehalococcoidia bacterium]
MTTRVLVVAMLGVAVVALAACDGWGEGRRACPEGSDRWTEYQLFFGLSQSDGGTISEEEWREFLADTVTPRFPDGLTVISGNGQWRDSSGEVTREGSKLLIIYAPPGEDGRRAIDEISEEYERRFDQESVLRVIGNACVSFS